MDCAMQIQEGRLEKMSFHVRKITVALVISTLLTQASYAQENLPMSARQKAEIEKKKADEQATDEAYKATLKHTQSVKQKADPWASVRTPSTNGNK
jgi:hypothetical protein